MRNCGVIRAASIKAMSVNSMITTAGSAIIPVLAVALSACTSDLATRRQEQITQDPLAMMRIAAAAETSGDPAGAMAFCRRAVALQPNSTAAQMGVARALAAQGEVDQAIEVVRSAQTKESFDAEMCSTLGRLLVAANRPDEALAAFEDGLIHDPQSAPMLIGQGVSLDTAGRHKDAQASYRKALQIDPNSRAAQKLSAVAIARRSPGRPLDGVWKIGVKMDCLMGNGSSVNKIVNKSRAQHSVPRLRVQPCGHSFRDGALSPRTLPNNVPREERTRRDAQPPFKPLLQCY